MSKSDHVKEFFNIAQAQVGRVSGRPSGDKALDSLALYHPTGPMAIEKYIAPYDSVTRSTGLRIAFVDWWTNGTFADENSPIRHRVMRWLQDSGMQFAEIDRRIGDLAWLAGLGTLKLNAGSPAEKVSWSECVKLIDRIDSIKIRSMGQVYDLVLGLLGPRATMALMRAVRPLFGHLPDPSWIPVGGPAACGLSWAMTGKPYAFHPAEMRGDEALESAKALLERSREPELWPHNDYAWTIDSLMMFCEFVWLYLKERYPAYCKDPWGGAK